MNRFEEEMRAALREGEKSLDGPTLARLGAARCAALASRAMPWWRMHAPAIGGAVLATVVAVAVLLPLQNGKIGPVPDASQQLREDPEFYEDLDFYLWLAESEAGGDG